MNLWIWLLWTELCPLKIAYVEAPTPNMSVFGDGAFREVIKVK